MMRPLGDLARNLMFQRQMTATNAAITTAAQEMTTGTAADPAGRLGGDLAVLHGIDADLGRLAAYDMAAAAQRIRMDAIQASVGHLDNTVASLSEDLARLSNAPTALASVEQSGLAAFHDVIDLLNSQTNGGYLFSGTATDRRPLPEGEMLLQRLNELIEGASSAKNAGEIVTEWFLDAAGFAAEFYGGNAAAAAVAIGDGTAVAGGMTVLEPALRDSLLAVSLVALMADGPFSGDAESRMALAETARQTLRKTGSGIDEIAGRIGIAQENISQVQAQNAAEASALQLARLSLVKVDEYDAATRLTDAQNRLELLFVLTSRLSALKLSDYLR